MDERAEDVVCRECPYPVVRVGGMWWHKASATDESYVPHRPWPVSRPDMSSDNNVAESARIGPDR